MPAPRRSSGPWGEAVRYWLALRGITRVELAERCGVEPKTISSVARGFHTTTRVLEKIAQAFEVELEQVLVSPERHAYLETRAQEIRAIVEEVVSRTDARTQPPHVLSVTEGRIPPVAALDPYKSAVPMIVKETRRPGGRRKSAKRKT